MPPWWPLDSWDIQFIAAGNPAVALIDLLCQPVHRPAFSWDDHPS